MPFILALEILGDGACLAITLVASRCWSEHWWLLRSQILGNQPTWLRDAPTFRWCPLNFGIFWTLEFAPRQSFAALWLAALPPHQHGFNKLWIWAGPCTPHGVPLRLYAATVGQRFGTEPDGYAGHPCLGSSCPSTTARWWPVVLLRTSNPHETLVVWLKMEFDDQWPP